MLVESIKPLSLADLRGGARGMRAPGVQILLISCSFWENLAKSYVGAPLPGGLAPPPRRNPGSATGSVIGFGDSAVSGFPDFNVYD